MKPIQFAVAPALATAWLFTNAVRAQSPAWNDVSPAPEPRYGHAMAYDAARGRMVVFGGDDGSYRGDTLEWDGSAWSVRSQTGPSPRYGPCMTYDAVRARVVLFGGKDPSSATYFGDTWEWDGVSWFLRSTTG